MGFEDFMYWLPFIIAILILLGTGTFHVGYFLFGIFLGVILYFWMKYWMDRKFKKREFAWGSEI